MYNAGEIQPDALVIEGVAEAELHAGRFVEADASDSEFAEYIGAAAPTGAFGVAVKPASAASKPAIVALRGRVAVEAAGAIKVGNFVSATTGGKAEAATVNTDYVLGVALEAAASAGDVILVDVFPGFINLDTTS